MSLKTWKEEFYPVPADQCPKAEAVAHSLRKWRGLTVENLERHKMVADGGDLNSGGVSWFRVNGCALCYHYADRYHPDQTKVCAACPLAKARGGVSCDHCAPGESESPFRRFRLADDPAPMIAALETALAREQAEAAAQAHEQAERAEQDAVERGVQEGTR